MSPASLCEFQHRKREIAGRNENIALKSPLNPSFFPTRLLADARAISARGVNYARHSRLWLLFYRDEKKRRRNRVEITLPAPSSVSPHSLATYHANIARPPFATAQKRTPEQRERHCVFAPTSRGSRGATAPTCCFRPQYGESPLRMNDTCVSGRPQCHDDTRTN